MAALSLGAAGRDARGAGGAAADLYRRPRAAPSHALGGVGGGFGCLQGGVEPRYVFERPVSILAAEFVTNLGRVGPGGALGSMV